MSGEKKRPRITKAMLTTLRRFGACSEGMRRLARFKYVDSALLRLPSDDVEWLCASTSGLCVSTSGLECFCDGSKPIGERVAAVLAAMKTICKESHGG